DKSLTLAHAEPLDGYTWLTLPLSDLAPRAKITLYGQGNQRAAFIAGVRLVGKSTVAPTVRPIRVAADAGIDPIARRVELAGFDATDENRRLWDAAPAAADWPRAERCARYAGIALTKVQRWLHERCLPIRDEVSGLFRPTGPQWNYRDTAADCYPFYVWAAYYTDRRILETVMIETLEAEQRLCNHLDRLPVTYDMDARRRIEMPLDALIFGASEYAKDGLVPIVEILGPDCPWFDRMRDIVDDIFKHAPVETARGRIPSTNIEVNGELLQVLARLYSVTGRRQYLDWAHRLADHYLLPGKFVPTRLFDHGCEIIGGLGLLFAVDVTAAPEKARQYRPHLEYLFDEILKRGTNSDGLIIGTLQDAVGPHDAVRLRDGWGYDLVAYLDYDLALGVDRYREAVRRPLTNMLKDRYAGFNWDDTSRDNLADSVEGGLYLLRREPVAEAFIWADREITSCLVDHTDPNRLWGVHKLEANTVRTVLIHTMLHTRNTLLRPWQDGLQLGAAPVPGGLAVFIKSDRPYQGRLHFDIPRHRLYLNFRHDWPRMNAVPEWFTVEPDTDHLYGVQYVDANASQVLPGRTLAQGLPVVLAADQPLRLIVTAR
ncbi:MAG: hypothetical protein JW810_03190, partial [Sedimentisphaerales bacterium]|nr:hypothetical protein [Sedimentisphaerales bacterium]